MSMDRAVSKRVFVYLEDSPVQANVVATGLSRAVPPILRSIADYIDGIAVYPVNRRWRPEELDRELATLCCTLPAPLMLVCKGLRRSGLFGARIPDALARISLASHMYNSCPDLVLGVVGADPSALRRTAELAGRVGRPYAVYVVDDFVAAMSLNGASQTAIDRARRDTETIFKKAEKVLTITDGLAESFRRSYGISAVTLQLAFEPRPRPSLTLKNQIIFVGSVNFLYAAGLRDLICCLEQVRNKSGMDLLLRLTVPRDVAIKYLGELPPYVVCGSVGDSDALASELGSSLFAFLPYSFDLAEKSMVATSFPSKSMEYLAYARSIVVYGPTYGVATRLFQSWGLPSVASSSADLEQSIQSHVVSRPDHSSAYRTYLRQVHSLSAVRKTICNALELGA